MARRNLSVGPGPSDRLEDCLVDAGHDVVHIIICHVGAGGEAEADLKEFFLYTMV